MAVKITSEELFQFTDGLAILLKADIPLDYALESLVGVLESARLRQVTASVVRMVREGHNLSRALAMSQAGFTQAYLGMVRVGEMGGNLDLVLEQLADMLKRNQELKKSLTSAVFYPLVLLMFSMGAVVFILIYVLPSFVSVFQDMKIPLPAAAEALITLGEIMDNYGLILAAGFGVLIILAVLSWRSPPTRLSISRAALSLGPLGKLLGSWQTVVFCRSLGIMLQSGVPINEAVRHAAAAVSSPGYKDALIPLDNELKEGSSLVAALSAVRYIPKVTLRMVALGEQTGSLAQMLVKAADFLESRVKFTVGRILVFTEPAIILFMGLLVGFVVVTMLTTIFTLTQGGF